MCFFSKQSKDAVELENRFNAKIDDYTCFKKSDFINGFTFPKTPVITNKNTKLIQHFQWGLVPFWAKNDDIKKYTLNAKIETLHTKPSFKNSINKRCLVIADGFYEWQWLDAKGKRKQKYLLKIPGNNIFTFGGIWSEWTNKKTGEIINSYSIVTTEANELMSKIHNSKKRMPVILNKKNEINWLNNRALNEFKKPEIELEATKITK